MSYNRIANKALFASKADETAKYLELRKLGYSNQQIAAKCGCHYNCVLNRIGKQSKELTNASKALGQKHRWALVRVQKREAQLIKQREETARLAQELNAEIKRMNALRSKLGQINPDVVANVPVVELVNVAA